LNESCNNQLTEKETKLKEACNIYVNKGKRNQSKKWKKRNETALVGELNP
jgi:hypothetical protein